MRVLPIFEVELEDDEFGVDVGLSPRGCFPPVSYAKMAPVHTGSGGIDRCEWRRRRAGGGNTAEGSSAAAAAFPWDVAELLRRVGPAEPLPMGGTLLRGALRPSQARWLCAEMIRLSQTRPEGSELQAELRESGQLDFGHRPRQLVSWCHPFSRASTCTDRPTALLAWAQALLHVLAPSASSVVVESLLAQVYGPGGSLLPHTDADLSWGLGVSLGAEAVFECLPEGDGVLPATVRLSSGDVIVGEFGLMRHAVRVPRDAPVPEWWAAAAADAAVAGAVRLNLLFRQPLSDREIVERAEGRSRRLYSVGLRALAEREGVEVMKLCVRLRHEAVD